MENYGLITYRENVLLYDDLLSPADRKQFVSYMATDIMFPEWKIWTQFLLKTNDGLRMDALEQSHPIEVEVHHARSIEEIFDSISYKKGSAVIRMLQGYLGDDTFQKSLSSYIKGYAGKNAKTDDLWGVLSENSGVELNSMMDAWSKKKGFPVISVKYKDNILEFEQSQFLSSGLGGDGLWIVPITLSIGSYNKCKTFLLETKSGKVDISELVHSPHENSSSVNEKNKEKCDDHFWVKVNTEQSGFYRVNYEDKLAARLKKAIESNCLSAPDKFGILDDTYALCEACKQPLSSLLSLMVVYRKELDFIVLSKLINVCYKVMEIASDAIPAVVNELKQFFIDLLLFSAEKKKNIISLLKLYREADTVQEKELVLRCLASCPDPNILLEVLNFMLSDEVRDQDSIYVLFMISSEGREIAWRWLKENWDLIFAKYGAMLTYYCITKILPLFCSNEKADEIEAFFASRMHPSFTTILKQSIEQIRLKARWVDNIRREQSLEDLVKQLASMKCWSSFCFQCYFVNVMLRIMNYIHCMLSNLCSTCNELHMKKSTIP
ncbi:aminopeptidase m1 [Quercus suber]|uniref:Aminopeptidase m1 n=1 Tax=Quercus suber TaxID=58331 RepID=A0AAW0M2Q0_QUESU